MPKVKVNGQLVCTTPEQSRAISSHLDAHLAATRAEEGCIFFDITPTTNPLVWQVDEVFQSESAFQAHKHRIAETEWAAATKGIKRDYSITLLKHEG